MFLLSVFPPLSITAEMLVDSFMLVVLVFPLLYFFLFNPLLLHITERERAEEGLIAKYQGTFLYSPSGRMTLNKLIKLED